MKKAVKWLALTGICCIGAGFLLTLVLFFGFHDEIMQHVDELSINADDFEEYFHENEERRYRGADVQNYFPEKVPVAVNGICGIREYHNDCEYRDSCEYYRNGECQNGCDYYNSGECPNDCEYYGNGRYHDGTKNHNNHNGYRQEKKQHNGHNMI